jgi:hypothetical protein
MLATLASGYATIVQRMKSTGRIYKSKYFFLLIRVTIKHDQTTENI